MGFKIVFFGIGLIIVIGAGALAFGALRWRGLIRSLVTQLDSASVSPRTSSYSQSELEGLPDPVQRYFRAVLREGQPIVVHARAGALLQPPNTTSHAGRAFSGTHASRWPPACR